MESLTDLANLDSLRASLQTKGLALALNLAAAVAIFVLGRLGARVLAKTLSRLLERSGTDVTLVRFLSSIVYALLLVFVTVAALERLGVSTTTVSAVVAAAGLAIGLALQGSLSNFASGVMIILLKHFRVGDTLEVAGQVGRVADIQVFSSVLETEDGTRVVLPNNTLTSGVIKVRPRKAGEATQQAA
ncbi:MAG: mechanosensitive ion channel [Myxococcaceae bacterium]|nr:mechanosensitive ion channel [Myxococcaceae bacterium]MCI0669791.1 mechanosensitive ion channel [Myxococcaceae bacterium]